jgi:hypothetical protein
MAIIYIFRWYGNPEANGRWQHWNHEVTFLLRDVLNPSVHLHVPSFRAKLGGD